MTQTSATLFAGKSPDLVPLGDGLNFSTPLAQVPGTVVPTPLFFLRSNNPPPTIEPDAWRMKIDGRVRRPLEVNLAEVRAAAPAERREIWLECAGNSRKRYEPAAEGNQWDEQAVSNAVFTGVPLRVLLERAGPLPDAHEVVTTGGDAATFQRGLPLEVALRPEVMLVWEMNDEPIPVANGGPIRLVVPGWAGIASVKWPVRMEVVNTAFRGHYNAERYIIVDEAGQTLRTVRELPVKSVFAWPSDGERVRPGSVTLFGFAWSGHAPIERVEVSTDGQRTWSEARLVRGEGDLAWTRWEHTWQAEAPGAASLAVRATDRAGHTQPQAVAWNRFGYEMNAIATREVTVAPR